MKYPEAITISYPEYDLLIKLDYQLIKRHLPNKATSTYP